MKPWLPANEPRCRSNGCVRGATCGRRQAALPASGAIVQDFLTTEAHGFGLMCQRYLPASECKPPEGAARRVFPPLLK